MSRKAALYQERNEVPQPDPPIIGKWDSANTTIAAGVAIFHLASSRVVLCYHSVDKYYFLPKGRRDASEDTGSAAEREGFEEVSGFLLNSRSDRCELDIEHVQTVGLPQPRPPSSNTHSPTQGPQSLFTQRGIIALCHGARLDPVGSSHGDGAVYSLLVHSGDSASQSRTFVVGTREGTRHGLSVSATVRGQYDVEGEGGDGRGL